MDNSLFNPPGAVYVRSLVIPVALCGPSVAVLWDPSFLGSFVFWCLILSRGSSPFGGRNCKAGGRASMEKTAFCRLLVALASAARFVGADSASEASSFRGDPDRRDRVRRPSGEHRLRPQSSGSVCDVRGELIRVDHVWLGHRRRGA